MREMMSNLEKLSNILDDFFKNDKITKLKEDNEKMYIDFINDNHQYLSFSFDKQPLPHKEFPRGIFPFFNRGTGNVTSFCDYIIFAEKKGKLFVLLIELKKGNNNVTKQLDAGKCFAEYVVSTLNRVYKQNINPEIRKISIRKSNIKPKQQKKRIEYIDNFHNFIDNKFWLKKYLE
jgi:hypothetical protein